MGAVPCPLPGSMQQYCTCKSVTMLQATCPSGSLPNIPRECRANWAVFKWQDEVQPQWDTGVQGRLQATHAPHVSRAEEVSWTPECMGQL